MELHAENWPEAYTVDCLLCSVVKSTLDVKAFNYLSQNDTPNVNGYYAINQKLGTVMPSLLPGAASINLKPDKTTIH